MRSGEVGYEEWCSRVRGVVQHGTRCGTVGYEGGAIGYKEWCNSVLGVGVQ